MVADSPPPPRHELLILVVCGCLLAEGCRTLSLLLGPSMGPLGPLPAAGPVRQVWVVPRQLALVFGVWALDPPLSPALGLLLRGRVARASWVGVADGLMAAAAPEPAAPGAGALRPQWCQVARAMMLGHRLLLLLLAHHPPPARGTAAPGRPPRAALLLLTQVRKKAQEPPLPRHGPPPPARGTAAPPAHSAARS